MIPGAARGGILLDKIPQNRRLRTILGPNSQSTRNIPCAAGRLKAVLFFTALSGAFILAVFPRYSAVSPCR